MTIVTRDLPARRTVPVAVYLTLALVALLAVTGYSGRASAEVVDVKTRNTMIRLLIEGPANPSHVVALFAGGHGGVEIADDGTIGWCRGNFAVKTRDMFHQNGMATAVVGPPDDMRNLVNKRGTDAYVTDFGNVIQNLRERFKISVWVHGTSSGTNSVALPTSKITDPSRRPDGIILSSSLTARIKFNDTVFDGKLENIVSPVLIVSHKNDSCVYTPPSWRQRLT